MVINRRLISHMHPHSQFKTKSERENCQIFVFDKCEIVQMSVHVTVNKIEKKKAQNKGQ